MKILVVLDTLTAGGAEIFTMRWASAANKRLDVHVELFVINQRLNNESTIEQNLKNVKVHYAYKWKIFDRFIAKFSSGLRKIGVKKNMHAIKARRRIRNLVSKEKFDIVHSHLFNVDLIVAESLKNKAVKHFTTIHGDYLRLSQAENVGNSRFQEDLKCIENSLNGIVCITTDQLNFFDQEMPGTLKRKIYNGYFIERSQLVERKNGDTFKIVMVSRGIKEKGWQEAILAFDALSLNNAELHFYGSSEYLKHLEKQNTNPAIIFHGFHPNPTSILSNFDLGILPSYYGSESLPTVVIEYLLNGLPVVGSDKGDIRQMLNYKGVSAGIVISVKKGRIDLTEFKDAILKLYSDNKLRQSMSFNASILVERFDMNNCINNYVDFYKSINDGNEEI